MLLGLSLAIPQIPRRAPGGIPAWVTPGAVVDLDFANQRYFWNGAVRTTAEFTTYVLNGSTFDARGLAPTDTIDITLALAGIGAFAPGAFAATIYQLAAPGSSKTWFELDDGTNNNKVAFAQTPGLVGQLLVNTANVSQAAINNGSGSNLALLNTIHGVAASWTTNPTDLSVNGIIGVTDTAATLPAVTTLRILKASVATSGPVGTGILGRLVLFNAGKTPAELNALSHDIRGPGVDSLNGEGTFAATGGWIVGLWTISSGVASKTAGSASSLLHNMPFVPDANYNVTFTVTAISAGTVQPRFVGGATVVGTARSAVGTYTETLVAGAGNNQVNMAADAAFAGSIDNVIVVKESVPWTPWNLGPALKAWWSADDHGTLRMVDDGAGLISSWTDRVSGIAVAGTTTARPTWASNSFNSAYAGLTFDGVANNLGLTPVPASIPTGAVAGNIFVLFSNVLVANGRILNYGTDGGNARSLGTVSSGGARLSLTTELVSLTDTVTNFAGNHIAGAEWAGTTQSGWIDGTAITPPSGTIATLATATGGLRMGGRSQGATLLGKGVFRHGFITTQLTTLQRQQLEGWLAWDVGLASLLPAGHPYKAARP